MQTKYPTLFSFFPLPPLPPSLSLPPPHNIMPSFSKAGAVLLLLVMASSIITITTTIVVASLVGSFDRRASSVGSFDHHVRKINKNTKKQGITNKEDTCTMEPFRGKSQYTNCAEKETEVEIACANKGNAAADGTLTPRKAARTPNSLCSTMMQQQQQ